MMMCDLPILLNSSFDSVEASVFTKPKRARNVQPSAATFQRSNQVSRILITDASQGFAVTQAKIHSSGKSDHKASSPPRQRYPSVRHKLPNAKQLHNASDKSELLANKVVRQVDVDSPTRAHLPRQVTEKRYQQLIK